MGELGLDDLKRIEPHIKRLTRSLATVNRSMAKTFEKRDALHLELVRRAMAPNREQTQIPFGNDK